MEDDSKNSDSIEDRVDTIEAEMGNKQFETIEARIDVIESEQEHLREDLDTIVESIRADKKKIADIDSVQSLHKRLETIEKNVATMRESLEEIVEHRE